MFRLSILNLLRKSYSSRTVFIGGVTLYMIDQEKYAVVTGASSGIGWFIAAELAKKGYSIVAVSNQGPELHKLKSELQALYSIHVRVFDCDLSKNDAAEKVFEFCVKNKLQIEVLVNNAGILIYGELTRIDVEQTKSILQLHMDTPAMLCRMFGAAMVETGKGYMMNVSSISSVMPYPFISLYGPTKTFIRQFTKALRFEMNDTGVHVSCLLPGATATALYDPEKVNLTLAMRLGVMKTPEDVAKAGVKSMFNQRKECVPGVFNKFIMLFVRIVPDFLIAFIYRKKKNEFVK